MLGLSLVQNKCFLDRTKVMLNWSGPVPRLGPVLTLFDGVLMLIILLDRIVLLLWMRPIGHSMPTAGF